MNLAFLTSHVSPCRVSTLIELRKLVDRLTIVLSSRDCAPGLPEAGVEVEYLKSIKVPRTRKHANGYVERYQAHVPYGAIGSMSSIDPDCLIAAEFGAMTALGEIYCKLYRKPLVVHADLSEECERGRGAARSAALIGRTFSCFHSAIRFNTSVAKAQPCTTRINRMSE